METLYHPSLYDEARPVPSLWKARLAERPDLGRPLGEDARCDVAVIGGGYTGLSAALHLARDHGVEVRVLEAGPIGWGASGRNGGLCCLAATKLTIRSMIDRFGLEETKRFYRAQLDGIDLVRSLGQDEAIDFEACGDGNFTVAHKPSRFPVLEQEAEALARLFGIETKLYGKEAFAEVGYDSQEQFGALQVAAGFGLNPLEFALGLGRAATRRGAVLHPRSRVLAWTKEGGEHELATTGGQLKARQVIVATNGFTPEDLHPTFGGRLLPVISNILTTRPLSAAELAAQSWNTDCPVCNTRELLFYFRLLPDKRFLFGARGDLTGRPEHGERMGRWLAGRLGQVFPAWREVPVEHFWRGLVCMTRKLAPSIGRLADDPTVWYALGYHGNGVNTAPWAGRLLARLIAGAASPERDVPAVFAGLPAGFPMAGLRLWVLRGAQAYYRFQDDFR
jgi:glycine/D-amino acid oxidase-like deaminating enzyme